MKRNINLIILTFEIAAIVVLHAVKIGQSQQPQENAANQGVSKTKISSPVTSHTRLLSIK